MTTLLLMLVVLAWLIVGATTARRLLRPTTDKTLRKQQYALTALADLHARTPQP